MRKKDMTKEERIQNAVAEIILTEGAAAVSTTKVAKKVGIVQSNVYLYFKNKEELLNSVYMREMNKVKSAPGLVTLKDKTIPTIERVDAYIGSIYHYAMKEPDSLTLIEQIKFLKGQIKSYIQDDMSTDNLVAELLREGIDKSILKPLPVNLHMTTVFSIIHAHTLNIQRGIYSQTEYSFEEIHQMIWDAIKYGGEVTTKKK